MNRTALLAALALCCSPAIAAETGSIAMDHGEIAYSLDRTAAEVTFTNGGRKVIVPSYYEPIESGRWNDSVLMFLSEGGSACPGSFVWLTLDDTGLKTSSVFGTCSDLAEIEDKGDAVMVSMPRMDAGHAGFLFDGMLVDEIDLGLKPSGVENPNAAASWEGRALYDLLSAAEMEPALLAIMDWQALEDLRSAGVVYSKGFEEDNGWFVATACQPHACSESSSGVAISTSDGTIIAGRWTSEGGGVLHGEPTSALPNRLRALLRDGTSQ